MGVPNEALMVEDPMGVETNIYQQVQKFADLFSQECHLSLWEKGDTIED